MKSMDAEKDSTSSKTYLSNNILHVSEGLLELVFTRNTFRVKNSGTGYTFTYLEMKGFVKIVHRTISLF